MTDEFAKHLHTPACTPCLSATHKLADCPTPWPCAGLHLVVVALALLQERRVGRQRLALRNAAKDIAVHAQLAAERLARNRQHDTLLLCCVPADTQALDVHGPR